MDIQEEIIMLRRLLLIVYEDVRSIRIEQARIAERLRIVDVSTYENINQIKTEVYDLDNKISKLPRR